MSSFEASAALTPEASGYRRTAAVVPTAQQRVIPVAELTAPAVGAIAPFVAPTLNTSAASDLETAMQAITNAGKATVAAGSLAESVRRDDVYDANNMALRDIPELMQRYQEGKLNELIDSQDLNTFSAQQAEAKLGLLSTRDGQQAYGNALFKVSSDMWLARRKDAQMAQFKKDAEGAAAAFFLPGSNPAPASKEWESMRSKYQWLDEPTFKSAVYGSALQNAAATGNAQAFDLISKSMDGPTDSVLFVEPARMKLNVQLRAAREIADKNYKDAMAGYVASGEAPSAILAKASDTIAAYAPNDPERQRALQAGLIEDLAAKAGTVADLTAIAAEAEARLTPGQAGRVQIIAQQRARPLIMDGLLGKAKDPTVQNFVEYANQNGLTALSPSDQFSVMMTRRKTVEDFTSDALLQGYEKGTIGPTEFALKAGAARDRYQANMPEWNQPEDSLSPTTYLQLTGRAREIESGRRTLNLANAYLTGSNLGEDGKASGAAASAAFSSLVTQGNLIDFSDGGKRFVGLIQAQKQVPDAAWYHVLSGLRGADVEGRRNAVRALTIINKMSAGDLANKMPTLTDNTANTAVGRTLDVLRPLTARMQSANLSDQQADAMLAAYDRQMTLEQSPMIPKNSMDEIKLQLNLATTAGTLQADSIYIETPGFNPKAAIMPGMDGLYSADGLLAAMASVTSQAYVKNGTHPVAASQQARDVANAAMQRIAINPTLLSGSDIDRILTEEMTKRNGTVEVATIGDSVVGTWEPRNDLPRWNPANQSQLAKLLQSSNKKSTDIGWVVPTPAQTFYVMYNDGTIGQFDAARTN